MGAIWQRYSQPTPVVPLKPGIDPQHQDPSADPNIAMGMAAAWESTVVSPVLPDGVMGEVPGTPVGGGGPADLSISDPDYGPGAGPGISQTEASALRGKYNTRDDGSFESRSYMPLTDRDGSWNLTEIPDNTDGTQDSPDTNLIKRSGVGTPNDPYARSGKRFKRFVDRVIDMHWWTPDYRPMYSRVPTRAQDVPAVAGNGLVPVSPFARDTLSVGGTQDQFVAPQERRSPQPWDNPLTTQGFPTDVGITSWGL
jgi:hypothetical protein